MSYCCAALEVTAVVRKIDRSRCDGERDTAASRDASWVRTLSRGQKGDIWPTEAQQTRRFPPLLSSAHSHPAFLLPCSLGPGCFWTWISARLRSQAVVEGLCLWNLPSSLPQERHLPAQMGFFFFYVYHHFAAVSETVSFKHLGGIESRRCATFLELREAWCVTWARFLHSHTL